MSTVRIDSLTNKGLKPLIPVAKVSCFAYRPRIETLTNKGLRLSHFVISSGFMEGLLVRVDSLTNKGLRQFLIAERFSH